MMSKLFTIIFLMAMTTIAQADGSIEHIGLQLGEVQAKSVKVSRGPGLTKSTQFRGTRVRFQEGNAGPNWAQISTPEFGFSKGQVGLSVSPSLTAVNDGRTGIGASVNLQLGKLISVSHDSYLGGFEQHVTTANIASKQMISLRVRRVHAGGGKDTRIGPVVKLGGGTRVWYSRSLAGGADSVIFTGNIRF